MEITFNNFEYLLTLILSGIIPLSLMIFHPFSPLKKYLKKVFISTILTAIPFIIWDHIVTFRGHWYFNSQFHLNFKILNLPFEEYLFFLVIPINCLFIWSLFEKYSSLKDLLVDFLKPFYTIKKKL
jgi:lycopene cyclase domain-containing protein